MPSSTDQLSRHMAEIARRLLGEPNRALSSKTEYRYGSNGSLSVEVAGPKQGTWYDHENQRGGGVLDLLWIYGDVRDEAAWDWLAREIGIEHDTRPDNDRRQQRQQMVATYTYVDERGQTLFWVYRYGPVKKFWQAQPGTGRDGLKRGADGKPTMQGARLVPYHLDELTAAAGSGKGWRVYVTEGEKDADRLRTQWGVVATTNPGGATRSKTGGTKWRSEFNRHFQDAEVVILPDNDEAGEDHAVAVAAQLLPVAQTVRIVALGGLVDKGDISDWLDAGASQSDLEDLIDSTEPLPKPPSASALLLDETIIRRMAKIDLRPVEWLWPGRIAGGKLTLIAGHPGLGKSQAALSIGATVSTGGFWPGGGRAKIGRVLILSVEDDPEDTQKPRLAAFGMDEERIETIDAIRTLDEDGKLVVRGFSIKDDIARLEAVLEDRGDVALIIVDPISAYLGLEVDAHNAADVRAVLQPLQELAARYRVAILGISHLRKTTDGDAVLQVTGSTAFVAAARAVFFVLRDENTPNRRLFLIAKNNLALDTSGHAYSIEPYPIDTPFGTIETSRVVWEPDRIDRTADDELAARRRQKDPDALKGEKRFAAELLRPGAMTTKDLKTACREAGFTWSKVQRAIEALDGFSCQINDVFGWQLP